MITQNNENNESGESILSILACDIGNTNISIACITGDEVENKTSVKLADSETIKKTIADLWCELDEPKKVAACSVNAPALDQLEKIVNDTISQETLVVSRDLPIPIKTKVEKPESVGVDRLCAAGAAFNRLNSACVVADLGSAITIDCVDEEGNFLGGAIMPGMQMSAKALNRNTAQLPEVELKTPDWVFGQNTDEAIIGGIVYGVKGALREFIEQYATELGKWPLVILTGGDAKLICENVQESGLVQAVVDDLVLRGIALSCYLTIAE